MTISLNSLFSSMSGKGNVTATFAEKLKWLGLGLVLLFALLVIDYFVNQSDEQFGESDLLPELPIETQMKQSSAGEAEVLDLYSQFDRPEVVETGKEDESTVAVVDSMSLAEQNQQSGLLSKLYIGDAIYRLSGIVRSGNDRSGESRAALSVSYTQQPAGSVTEIGEVDEIDAAASTEIVDSSTPATRKTNISLFKGDNLGPYRVESIDSRRMVLVDNGRRLWLELFVPKRVKQDAGTESITSN